MKSHVVAQYAGDSSPAFFERIERLASLRVDYIQLRAPELSAAELYETGRRCRELIGPATKFVINRRYDIAVGCAADGVHLPGHGLPVTAVRQSAPQLTVGRSCHSLSDCTDAVAEGSDYALLGPVFDTRSKASKGRIRPSSLRAAVSLGIEIFALGGVSRDNLSLLRDTGIAGVAAITLFMEDEPLEEIVEEVRTL